MFGQAAGAERNLTKLNQHVVTRIETTDRIMWVLHTRAEDPVSVLIMELNKDVEAKRITADDVLNIISSIRTYKTLNDKSDYEAHCKSLVRKWGASKDEARIETLVNACKGSCAFGWEQKQ